MTSFKFNMINHKFKLYYSCHIEILSTVFNHACLIRVKLAKSHMNFLFSVCLVMQEHRTCACVMLKRLNDLSIELN